METVYIDYLSKKHNFKQVRKEFTGPDAYERAKKWAKKNIPNLHEDMIKCVASEKKSKKPNCVEYRIMIEKANMILSDGDLSTIEAIEAIAAHPEQDEPIDNVDGVVVWEPLEFKITCEDFLSMVNYPQTKPEPKFTYYLFGEQASRTYHEKQLKGVLTLIKKGAEYAIHAQSSDDPSKLIEAYDGWNGYAEITEAEYNTLNNLPE